MPASHLSQIGARVAAGDQRAGFVASHTLRDSMPDKQTSSAFRVSTFQRNQMLA